ncbi:DUF6318 family protein [Nocardioides jejuensis]|uniref:DUF6318 domain-containing protein n=1 Tax=Nocardioides jejuensis TaxID=2502782 RepID=A0A4R1CKC2_9ACTN|nr:DUF6318 family protein [Nocardioides jejuensis]TCJ30448.1 hypothetical protein EPD65_04415 [Nocardioides jejuensis]
MLPDLAKRDDAIGAKAFVKYWFAVANHAIATGDTAPLAAISAKDCGSCDALAASVRKSFKDGGHIDGGALHVVGLELDPRLKPPLFRFALRLRQDPKRVLNPAGMAVTRESGASALFFVAARRVGAAFEFVGMERIDD